MARVDKTDTCWNWFGPINIDGYGRLTVSFEVKKPQVNISAHRLSYLLHKGDIPEGLLVRHTCIKNRRCVNPEHLILGTNQDNMDDMMQTGGKSGIGPKLNFNLAEEIRELFLSGSSRKELASKYGVKQVSIRYILQYRTYKTNKKPKTA